MRLAAGAVAALAAVAVELARERLAGFNGAGALAGALDGARGRPAPGGPIGRWAAEP